MDLIRTPEASDWTKAIRFPSGLHAARPLETDSAVVQVSRVVWLAFRSWTRRFPSRVKRIRRPSGEIVLPPPASTLLSVEVAGSNSQKPSRRVCRRAQLASGAN